MRRGSNSSAALFEPTYQRDNECHSRCTAHAGWVQEAGRASGCCARTASNSSGVRITIDWREAYQHCAVWAACSKLSWITERASQTVAPGGIRGTCYLDPSCAKSVRTET
eukprot:549446-Rhodomonas_salina.2